MIAFFFNGKKVESERGVSLAEFLRGREFDRRIMIVERNGEVIHGEYAEALNEGDSINIYRVSVGG